MFLLRADFKLVCLAAAGAYLIILVLLWIWLPPVRVAGYFGTWPEIQRTAKELALAPPSPMRLPPPSCGAISRMEEAITWNRFLERDDAHLMWSRAEGTPWKELCYRFGISRPTADRRYRYALALIAWRLNGNARSERTPSLRSLLGVRRAA